MNQSTKRNTSPSRSLFPTSLHYVTASLKNEIDVSVIQGIRHYLTILQVATPLRIFSISENNLQELTILIFFLPLLKTCAPPTMSHFSMCAPPIHEAFANSLLPVGQNMCGPNHLNPYPKGTLTHFSFLQFGNQKIELGNLWTTALCLPVVNPREFAQDSPTRIYE